MCMVLSRMVDTQFILFPVLIQVANVPHQEQSPEIRAWLFFLIDIDYPRARIRGPSAPRPELETTPTDITPVSKSHIILLYPGNSRSNKSSDVT